MSAADALLAAIRERALAYPEAYEEAPWGDLAAKVKGKVFAFYGLRDGRLSLTAKLPISREDALRMPDVEPTPYGLGKHGWVTGRFPDPDEVDLPTLFGWLDESYRSVAPKKLARSVPEGGPVPAAGAAAPDVPEGAPEVVVVSDDALRAERAVRGLAELGVQGVRRSTRDLEALASDAPAALLVDVGRSRSVAHALAAELAVLHFDCPLLLAGLREDGDTPPGALVFRDPPGDPAVLARVAALVRPPR